MNDLISIIVPVYNVEKYLEKCVKTLMEQSYKKIEIILVDDGSTDSSGKLVDRLANNDVRITVVHKKNAGLGMARNTGLDYATGKYVAFVLSSEYKIVLIYYNLKGFEQNKQTIEYEQMRVQFNHILYGYSDSEVYTFRAKDRFIQMFASKYHRSGATLESSDIRMRSVKQKFFQILEMYEWVMESPYKVFMFSTDVWELEVDISFYAALILAQQLNILRFF